MEVGDKLICLVNTTYEPFLTIGEVYIINKIEYKNNVIFVMIWCDDNFERKVNASRFDCVTLKRVETIDSILL